MTSYITTLKSLEKLPELTKDDKLFLVGQNSESIKMLDMESLFNKLKDNVGELHIKPYPEKKMLDFLIGAIIATYPDDNFVLMDDAFPALSPQIFGDRVKKWGSRESSPRRKKTISNKKTISGIKTAPSAISIGTTTTKAIYNAKETKKTLVQDNNKNLESVEEVPVPKLTKIVKPEKKVGRRTNSQKSKKVEVVDVSPYEETPSGKSNSSEEIAKRLEQILKLNPEEIENPMGMDILYLIILNEFQKASTDEDIKNGILAKADGDKIWQAVTPHFDEIKSLVKSVEE